MLPADLCESKIRQLYRDSLMLAVARYIKEHPDVTNLAQNWLGSNDASKWSAKPMPELEHEALQIWEQVDKWDEFAKANHPEIWEAYNLKPFNVQLNLESALSGSFHVAMGELASFLDIVGAEFKKIVGVKNMVQFRITAKTTRQRQHTPKSPCTHRGGSQTGNCPNARGWGCPT